MIPKQTIDQIFETSIIEEVVGDFVTLKKKGSNYWGLCPFHNEKTPSFSVAPAKGIYKCFGCGKGGNSVNFIMEHEQATYPEALRFLAKKYGIEIEEEEQTAEQIAAQNERESLYLVSNFAAEFFEEQLHNTDQGKSIGLSYFKERGFSEETIKKFHLGYSPEKRTAFSEAAKEKGYQEQYIEGSGLSLNKGGLIDRFYGRVMFPIHNLSGRVIAFGGRTLRTDKKIAKYINSPETEIYHKSKILYGIFQAKKSIIEHDTCLLVEGYTDVVSLHQAGVENVVASSGTSLTVDQIRLIRRYTKNISILYDGDAAGIKASFRGIDLILEEDMNVKVVLFPDGEDPDSYAKKVDTEELKAFVADSAQDFITFKTSVLLEDVGTDPVKKAGLIREIVESIALIPDQITRSVYVQQCSSLLHIDEPTLISELNKIRRKKFRDKAGVSNVPEDIPFSGVEAQTKKQTQKAEDHNSVEFQERDIIRILLHHGNKTIEFDEVNEEGKLEHIPVRVADFIFAEILSDNIKFENPTYQLVFNEYSIHLAKNEAPSEKTFTLHSNTEISQFAVDLYSSPYLLSKEWERHHIFVITEEEELKKAVLKGIYSLKIRKLEQEIYRTQEQMKQQKTDEEIVALMEQQKFLDEAKKQISNELGRVVLK